MLSLQGYGTKTNLQSGRAEDSGTPGSQEHDYYITPAIIEDSVTFRCRSICNLFIAPRHPRGYGDRAVQRGVDFERRLDFRQTSIRFGSLASAFTVFLLTAQAARSLLLAQKIERSLWLRAP